MKSRTVLYVSMGLFLIVLVGIWYFYERDPQALTQVFPATANRDCAPWDGGAFTVSIPLRDGATLSISIYQSPDIKRPASFSFPDQTMSEGNAALILPGGLPEQLTGKLWFQRVSEQIPVEGRFQLRSESGVQFEGEFLAEWGNEIVYCG